MPDDTQWQDGDTPDAQMIAAWYRLKRQYDPKKPNRKRNLVIALSWLRRYPHVFRAVTNQDLEAASIAVQNQWESNPTHADIVADWATITPDQISDKIRNINASPKPLEFGSWLATALHRHAPQHLPMLPPAWIAKSHAASPNA